MKVLVLGDLLVELSCRLPYRFRDVRADRLTSVGVDIALGGSAANFAFAAARRFDEVTLGGRVGDDAFGAYALGELEAAGVRCRVRRTPDMPTGLAIYQRDSSSEGAKGVRHLVVATPSANDAFGLDDLDELGPVLGAVDLVVTDGYAMRHTGRRVATLAAMTEARSAGARVVFDVVPHDCFRRYELDDLLTFARSTSVVIIEARTLLGFLGTPMGKVVESASVDHAAAVASQLWPDKIVFLRFGIGNVDEVIGLDANRAAVRYRTGYVGSATPRGFGDRLAVDELARLTGGSGGFGGFFEREAEEGSGDVVLQRVGHPLEEEVR